MKKCIFGILCCLIFLFVFCSCRTEENHIDLSLYGEDFQDKHKDLFYQASCDHYLRYKDVSPNTEADIYHSVNCLWGNCDYETRLEPHSIQTSTLFIGNAPKLKENGYYYHAVYVFCVKCRKSFYLDIYCPLQSRDCTANGEANTCLANCDWKEILCDTLYEISVD